MSDQGFSGTEAARLVGITYRQLDYWDRTALVSPSLGTAKGSGSRRRYAYRDLLELKTVKMLLDAGIKLESVRDAFTFLREKLDADIVAAHIVISDGQVVLCDGEALIDVVRGGQGVLNLLSMAGVIQQVDAAIVELPRRAAGAAATDATETPQQKPASARRRSS